VSGQAGFQPPFEIRTVAVIGAGVAGLSFALACAAAGFYVVLEDVMPAKLRRAEAEYADASKQGPYGALELASTVEDAVREAEIFSMIDRMAPPKTILCTPSYALSITDLASCVYRPERCVAVRGELVEKGTAVRLLYPATAGEDVLAVTARFLRSLGLMVETEVDPDVPVLMKNAGRVAV
jgi:3-hydroxybutyryl-CoA dehydrogenase